MKILNPTPEQIAVLEKWNTGHPGKIELSNGQLLYHKWWLTGGGDFQYPYFIEAIKKYGKPHYNSAYEWCCGHGRIGFEVLTQGLCDRIAFSDCYDLAVNTCLENGKQLGYEDRVKGYITPIISAIPTTEKWDLVIGNPPNSIKGGFLEEQYKDVQPIEMIRNAQRITADEDFEAHREFFANIGNYITEDADLFISVHNTVFTYIADIYQSNNFKIENIVDMLPYDPALKVVHFKKI